MCQNSEHSRSNSPQILAPANRSSGNDVQQIENAVQTVESAASSDQGSDDQEENFENERFAETDQQSEENGGFGQRW